MNNELNLSEILKGHENEIFYSPILGDLKLKSISDNCLILRFKSESNPKTDTFLIGKNGKLVHGADEIAVFPSKDQRNWNKWLEEQKHKVPKTWSELYNINSCNIYNLSKIDEVGCVIEITGTPIEKSALALLKIHQLIEVGYGGSLTDEEWETLTPYYIWYDTSNKCFMINRSTLAKLHIAFHTKKQAEEFLNKPENVELLKDYFMI